MNRERPEAPRGSILDRFLRLFSDVRPGEGSTALTLLVTIFLLLVCYYVLKTVREPLVLASAAADLRVVSQADIPVWLKNILIEQDGPQLKAFAAGCQALLLLIYVPAYSWLASRISRVRLIVGVSVFFVLCIQLFFALKLAGALMLGFVFYIWVGIFSVSMIAQFWSFGNDIYTEEQGKRLFPIIGVGATAGAPVGSEAASQFYAMVSPELVKDVDYVAPAFNQFLTENGLDPSFLLLQAPAVLLILFTALMVWVARRYEPASPGAEAASADEEASSEEGSKPAKEGARDGFGLILRSPYVRLIAAVILTLNLVNTLGEFLLSDLVAEAATQAVAAGEAASRGAFIGGFYGRFFSIVNVAALLLQLFVVSRLVKRFGLRAVLFALPLVAFGSYALFAAGLGLVVLRWAKTAENSTDYSIMNTGKAMVWLPTTKAAKYAGKQAVDTFVVRSGDVLAALLFIVGSTALEMGLQAMAAVNLVLVVLWLGFTFLLVRASDRVNEDPTADIATHEPGASS